MPRDPRREESGFSLIETLVAIAILSVAVASLAQMLGVAAAANQRAARRTLASLAGRQKMEELLGAREIALMPSPPGALAADVGGYSDVTDGLGIRPSFVRRWSIDPLPADPLGRLVLQVVVLGRDGVEARLITVCRKQGV